MLWSQNRVRLSYLSSYSFPLAPRSRVSRSELIVDYLKSGDTAEIAANFRFDGMVWDTCQVQVHGHGFGNDILRSVNQRIDVY